VRVTRDIDMAEECVQDAYARALSSWRGNGIPAKPGAWLTTVARRRAIDLLRRRSTEQRAIPALADQALTVEPVENEGGGVPDDRLRLMFTCCHPALSTEAQVGLTLRLLCGLTTAEVARAFLVSEPTMAARVTRAKKKIAGAGIPFRVPPPSDIVARTDAVLTVVHLLFTTGHTAPAGSDLVRRDLLERALDLAGVLRTLLPEDAAVAGLLALLLLTDARRQARTGPGGQLVLLAEQDRTTWDHAAIKQGTALLREALLQRPPGRFALMAAIAAVHAESLTWEETDWHEIVGLYDLLVDIWPSPVVALNRAAAIGFAHGPEAGLAQLDALATEPLLAGYSYMASSRAELLRRLGRNTEARLAYEEALMLSENLVERDFLSGRLQELSSWAARADVAGPDDR
jgi:RNA polymerase sigma factor (sigma-70 family)